MLFTTSVFRVVPGDDYLHYFASDRSHMARYDYHNIFIAREILTS